jgi:hypothetical protein
MGIQIFAKNTLPKSNSMALIMHQIILLAKNNMHCIISHPANGLYLTT